MAPWRHVRGFGLTNRDPAEGAVLRWSLPEVVESHHGSCGCEFSCSTLQVGAAVLCVYHPAKGSTFLMVVRLVVAHIHQHQLLLVTW